MCCSHVIFISIRCVRRTNRHTIAMMFVRLSGIGVHCDHTMHFSVDLSSWLDSPIFWAPWQQSISTCSQPSYSSSTWKRGGVWMCILGLDVNINIDK